jgi:hypothetical protein
LGDPTRDALHAAFLTRGERLKIAAERPLARGPSWLGLPAVDPVAEDIERNLIALHQSGAHAAAAEQYAHFAASQRAEYAEPPPPNRSARIRADLSIPDY